MDSGDHGETVLDDYGTDNRVLVIGSGGREHSLVRKLEESPHVEKIFVAPGNPGMLREGKKVQLVPLNVPGIVPDMRQTINAFQQYFGQLGKLTHMEQIGLVVVGPEDPICLGIADLLNEITCGDVDVFAPDAFCSQLEGSKLFAKQVMIDNGIPTAGLEMIVTGDNLKDAFKRITELGAENVVLKGNDLAAGKGVVVSDSTEFLRNALTEFFESNRYGCHSCVLLEERLHGTETSAIAVCDGSRMRVLVPTKDHKSIFDGDVGPNTGGMGAYSPNMKVGPGLSSQIYARILRPLMAAMERKGHPYKGVLYAGLMLTEQGPKVLEINCRFGDPETQTQMALMRSNLYPLLKGAARGRMPDREIETHPGSAHCLTLASYGYPGSYAKGWPIHISGNLPQESSLIFAGVQREDDRLLTNGGRVMYIVSRGSTLSAAADASYSLVEKGLVSFPGMTYRRDIGRELSGK